MDVLKIYEEDLQIAKSLINRDERVTLQYFYKQCYPLFKSIFNNYYTDCHSCKEFMDEIYVLVLAPSKKTGKCQMENFKGESPLIFWIKSACLFYCYNKYNLKKRRPPYEPLEQGTPNDGREIGGDRFNPPGGSIDFDLSEMNRSDVEILLSMMPNLRYRKIIRLLHLEQKTYKEAAEALGMSMDNFYNKRILAEEQFKRIQKKEGGYE